MNPRSLVMTLSLGMVSFIPATTAAVPLLSEHLSCVLVVDSQGINQKGDLIHVERIVFRVMKPLELLIDATEQPPLATELDVKMQTSPSVTADFKGMVLLFLDAADTPANRNKIVIVDADYAPVCLAPEI